MSKKKISLNYCSEDFAEIRNPILNFNESDFKESPKKEIVFEEIDFQDIPSLIFRQSDFNDICIPSIKIDASELRHLEQEIQNARIKLDWSTKYQINTFHGTGSSANADSIIKNGWKVGHGAAWGYGIYFGFIPENNKTKSIKMPLSGKSFNSGTAADSYSGGADGALILSNVDWGTYLNMDNNKKVGEGKLDSKKSPRNGIGVMLHNDMKNYWRPDKIRILGVYYKKSKKLKIIE